MVYLMECDDQLGDTYEGEGGVQGVGRFVAISSVDTEIGKLGGKAYLE